MRQDAEERKRTLRTLMELAEGNSPSACYDDRRVVELLRSQSSASEMRELGMSEPMIQLIFEAKE